MKITLLESRRILEQEYLVEYDGLEYTVKIRDIKDTKAFSGHNNQIKEKDIIKAVWAQALAKIGKPEEFGFIISTREKSAVGKVASDAIILLLDFCSTEQQQRILNDAIKCVGCIQTFSNVFSLLNSFANKMKNEGCGFSFNFSGPCDPDGNSFNYNFDKYS
jgi:hypothetical protein